MSIKLTIGTAVYNVGEDLLRAHIEGIKSQLTDETELLLIDDGSTDNSGEICREYAQCNSHIRYINMGKNQGLSCVRNFTIKEAQGKWLFFADGDDLLSDYAVKTVLELYDDSDADIIIHDRCIFVDEKPKDEVCKVVALTELPTGVGREISLSALCLKPFNPHDYGMGKEIFYHAAWGAIYRKDFVTEHDFQFPLGLKRAEDSVFNTCAYNAAKKIAYLPYTMYYYRKNPRGVTKRYNADDVEITDSIMRNQLECMEKVYPGDEEIRKLYYNNRLISLTIDRMRLDIFHKNNPKSRKVRIDDFERFVNTEPFKSAINSFDIEGCDWWGWMVPIKYARKKNFAILDLCFKNETFYRLLGGVEIRLKRIKKKFT